MTGELRHLRAERAVELALDGISLVHLTRAVAQMAARRARDAAPGRPGRPPDSPTGERRAEVRRTIAPSARTRVEAEAARRGVSPSAPVEEWALTLAGG